MSAIQSCPQWTYSELKGSEILWHSSQGNCSRGNRFCRKEPCLWHCTLSGCSSNSVLIGMISLHKVALVLKAGARKYCRLWSEHGANVCRDNDESQPSISDLWRSWHRIQAVVLSQVLAQDETGWSPRLYPGPFFHAFLSSGCELLIGLFFPSHEYCIHPQNCPEKVVRNFIFGMGKAGWTSDAFLMLIVFLWLRHCNRLSISLSLISGALSHFSWDILGVLDFLTGTSDSSGLSYQA